MTVPSYLYRPSLALLTDFYELTMAYAAWKSGAARKEAAFTLSFRENPYRGGFSVAAGLEDAVDLVAHLRFEADDLAFLRGQQGDGRRAALRRGLPRRRWPGSSSGWTSTRSPRGRWSSRTSRSCG